MSAEADRTLVVEADMDRLDRTLARAWSDLSRSRLQALIRAGRVAVDGIVVRDPAAAAEPGAHVRLTLPPPERTALAPEAIRLTVVHEDADLIVIDKPAGLVVPPSAGHDSGTLVHALLAHCGASLSGIGGVSRPGIVHRLDKNTSGLMVVAKTDRAHANLAAQFADHGRSGPLERAYLALVWGVLPRRQGTIDLALGRSSRAREKIAVVTDGHGRHAVTHYAVLEALPPGADSVACLVRCTLKTGRTHQIRVHLAHLGCPLLGDDLYGAGFRTKAARLSPPARDALAGLGRQALHAAVLGFRHPVTGETLRFESPLPPDMATLQDLLADL